MGTDTAQSVVLPTDLCASTSLNVIPSTGNYALVFQRVLASAWQAAGHLYAPLDLMKNWIQGAPYRLVEQRFSAVKGQERYNFISTITQISHSL